MAIWNAVVWDGGRAYKSKTGDQIKPQILEWPLWSFLEATQSKWTRIDAGKYCEKRSDPNSIYK